MRSLSAQELLDVWERGRGKVPVERALILLTAGSPDISEDTFARMPIGERDRQLLALRDQVFGPDLEAVARCQACNELLETTMRSTMILATRGMDPASIAPLHYNGYSVRFRLPDSRDLIAITGEKEELVAKNLLLGRCIVEVKKGFDPVPYNQLPGGVLDAVLEAMDNADPQANISLSLTCPSCGEAWQEGLDILSFFWDEIDNWADRTLNEVHLLALAYGWSENEVLSLSAARRQIYLEKVNE